MKRVWRNRWFKWIILWGIVGGAITHLISTYVFGIKIWYHLPYFSQNLSHGVGNIIGSFAIFFVWVAIGVFTAPRK